MSLLKMCDSDVRQALKCILSKVESAYQNKIQGLPDIKPRLVAVSKTKPKELIFAAYDCGQRHFGENYVQELVEKSNDAELLEKCKEIKWHFIGNLQTNKVNKIVSIPGIFVVETVDSKKLATLLDKAWDRKDPKDQERLNIMIQINTSGEEAKNGAPPSEAASLAKHVVTNCPNLNILGLMTIGRFDHDLTQGPNPDFQVLIKCREDVAKALNRNVAEFELSMGMSNDFEHAIEVGSTNVRVGSSIFGARQYNKPAENSVDKLADQVATTNIG
ncbi:pyridoxal phosphate homeostasis protein-like isoform X2 [Macrosteles quadrilineatus]|uniref:pyridoxal phosphate homeostasis protein-like isoform X2 n=1 Tax=Macrosteles quadrilineatus TaxID=74068 RepID=UPI0023E14796|nr:pyridoxal phosphate homeostasis protein-like isoform X2 [Macrosteles quadrilineatus]XP_054258831.1 pyridoxal phosphate homeostasis protein-like isoform X2 [Macrosteles quadrilineatus]